MNRDRLMDLLERVGRGETTPEAAAAELAGLPLSDPGYAELSHGDVGYARVDTHRGLRCGFPEVIFCQGKSPPEVREIAVRLLACEPRILATRADRTTYEAVLEAAPDAVFHERAGAITVDREESEPEGLVVVLCAGTADVPVAEEARVTATALGAAIETVYDCGVAGIHRVISERDRLARANALVVAAGMEGALASVVGGLTDRPVFAVPTSIGYGASFGGLAPLLTMLNSCAAGVTVVNIDNGFGAGYAAAMVNRLVVRAGREVE